MSTQPIKYPQVAVVINNDAEALFCEVGSLVIINKPPINHSPYHPDCEIGVRWSGTDSWCIHEKEIELLGEL